ncbi:MULTISPECIES: carboxypeptidase-like regulatory domain-containing protein [unclassified Corallococcus]|uniref:carboxypeptidase-like regulatory domain-containing protein n=1 Tax=unclassified Corallococcus TaxID=2685029 RepID=UPI0022A9D434|nr:carboxypeptidase-like regulatory domain-containing protein [Corallococcus sp. NCRR]WAS88479.1 carboxypeptidase-like regulatory domain-containing protein [Corallococcus sp. NCRR]
MLVLGLGVAVVSFREPRGPDAASNPRARDAETPHARARFAPLLAPHAQGSLRITGVVRDAQGPVAGVQVSASRVDADTLSERSCPKTPPGHDHSPGRMRPGDCCFLEMASEYARLVEAREGEAPVLAQTVTEDDGTFVLEGLPTGAVTLWALGDTGAAVQPDIPAGGDNVTLTLEDGVSFSGTVVEALTRAPLPGARVTLIHEAGSRFFDALADARGRFRVGPLPPGRYLRVASAQGCQTKAFRENVWLDVDVDVTLALRRQHRLEGVVLTPEGLPASGLDVHLTPSEEEGATTTMRSDEQGRFVFEDVPAIPHELWTREDTAHAQASGTPPGKVVLRMMRFGFMEGTVRDEQHRPLAGVRVRAQGHPPGDLPDPEVLTDEAGRYRLGPLMNHSVDLFVQREHYLDRREKIRLGADHPGPWDFTLMRAMLLEGQVVDPRGLPLAGAQVRLDLPRDIPGRVRDLGDLMEPAVESDATGHFTVDSANPGPSELTVAAPGFRVVRIPVEVPSTGVRVGMSRGASVSGTVMDAAGRPLSNVDVRLWSTEPLSGDPYDTSVDARGAFSLEGLEAGHYVLEARLRTPGIEHTVSQPVDLEERTQATVTVRFEEGRTLQGMTVASDGRPMPGVRVQACLPLEDVPAWQAYAPACTVTGESGVLSGPDGRFVFKHLTAPAYQLIAWKEGHAFAPSRSRGGTPDTSALRVTPEQGDVRLVLEPRPRLRGQVVSDDGAPLPCEVREQGDWVRVPDGTFNLPLPDDGARALTVRAKGFFNLKRKFVVKPEGDIDLGTLRMIRSRTVRFIVLDEATRAPLAGIRVRITPAWDESFASISDLLFHIGPLDAEGSVELEGLPFQAATFSVTVEGAPEQEERTVFVDAVQQTVTVMLPEPKR